MLWRMPTPHPQMGPDGGLSLEVCLNKDRERLVVSYMFAGHPLIFFITTFTWSHGTATLHR
jgi:hypothetical protein